MYRSLLSPISLLDNLADPSSEEVDEAETLDVDVTGTLELRRPKGLWDHESICLSFAVRRRRTNKIFLNYLKTNSLQMQYLITKWFCTAIWEDVIL